MRSVTWNHSFSFRPPLGSHSVPPMVSAWFICLGHRIYLQVGQEKEAPKHAVKESMIEEGVGFHFTTRFSGMHPPCHSQAPPPSFLRGKSVSTTAFTSSLVPNPNFRKPGDNSASHCSDSAETLPNHHEEGSFFAADDGVLGMSELTPLFMVLASLRCMAATWSTNSFCGVALNWVVLCGACALIIILPYSRHMGRALAFSREDGLLCLCEGIGTVMQGDQLCCCSAKEDEIDGFVLVEDCAFAATIDDACQVFLFLRTDHFCNLASTRRWHLLIPQLSTGFRVDRRDQSIEIPPPPPLLPAFQQFSREQVL